MNPVHSLFKDVFPPCIVRLLSGVDLVDKQVKFVPDLIVILEVGFSRVEFFLKSLHELDGEFRVAAEPLFDVAERIEVRVSLNQNLVDKMDHCLDHIAQISTDEFGVDKGCFNQFLSWKVFDCDKLLQEIV